MSATDTFVACLITLAVAAVIAGFTYVGHQGSVREDALRTRCIELGGIPIKAQNSDTICFRGAQ